MGGANEAKERYSSELKVGKDGITAASGIAIVSDPFCLK